MENVVPRTIFPVALALKLAESFAFFKSEGKYIRNR